MPDVPKEFLALDGVRFLYSRLAMCLRAGVYGSGRGALTVEEIESGTPYAVLTVNMPETDLATGELLIRTGNGLKTFTDITEVRSCVLKLGIFEPAGRFVDSGHVEDYAAVWRFKRCEHGPYVALCPTCLDEIDKRFRDAIDAMLAAKAAAILIGADPL